MIKRLSNAYQNSLNEIANNTSISPCPDQRSQRCQVGDIKNDVQGSKAYKQHTSQSKDLRICWCSNRTTNACCKKGECFKTIRLRSVGSRPEAGLR